MNRMERWRTREVSVFQETADIVGNGEPKANEVSKNHIHFALRKRCCRSATLRQRLLRAHGIRHRARDIITGEFGPQSEIELQQKLAPEVEAERLTRLDRLPSQEQEREDFVDLVTGRNG